MTLAGFEQAAKFLHSLGFVHPEDVAYSSQLLALASALAIIGLPNDLGRTQSNLRRYGMTISRLS